MYHRFWLIPTCSPIPIPYLKCLSLSFFASSVGTSLADSCLASSRHLKLLKRSDVPAQTISHPIPVINGEGDAPRPCNFHINHYFWQSPYIMSFKTCSHCVLFCFLNILFCDLDLSVVMFMSSLFQDVSRLSRFASGLIVQEEHFFTSPE